MQDYAGRGNLDKIIQKVGLGRDINRHEPLYKNTVIGIAAACGNCTIVRWCLEHQADANAPEVHGWTPLMLAAIKGHAEIAQVLLTAGVDDALRDTEGRTALMLATNAPDWAPDSDEAKEGRKQIVKLLTK